MPIRPVLPYPHALLKQTSNPIPVLDAHAERLLTALMRDMADTVEAAGGMGLSAVQIGAPWRVIYVAKPIAGEPLFIVNPVMVGHSELFQHYREGCMSCPEVEVDIQRWASVRVIGRRANGDDVTVQASGLLAQALQHEINHLDGRCIIDCAQSGKRRFLTDQVKRKFRGHQGKLLDYAPTPAQQGA
jgi:peptide deformylase